MSEIKDLIQHALDQDYNKASEVFGQVMSIKTQEVLDQAKVKLAGQIYNGEEADQEDEELAAMSDEELDAAVEGEDDESEEDEVSEEEEDEASDDDEKQ